MRWLLLVAALGLPLAGQTVAELEAENARYLRLLSDWGQLVKYGSDNAELRAPKEGESRVVFFGDDIFEKWEKFFPGKKNYLNRGITHQTTPQMLVRFRQDVIGLQPKVVVILGGANDLGSRCHGCRGDRRGLHRLGTGRESRPSRTPTDIG